MLVRSACRECAAVVRAMGRSDVCCGGRVRPAFPGRRDAQNAIMAQRIRHVKARCGAMTACAPASALNCGAAEQMGIGGIVETQASAQGLRDALVRGARAAGVLSKGAGAGRRASAHAHALADSPCGAEEIGVTALGELLVDFTDAGEASDGRRLFERNPGGAPANVAVGAARLGVRAAFVGKVGADVNGRFLRGVLEREDVDCTGLITDAACATTLSFVEVSPDGERSFSFARKPGGRHADHAVGGCGTGCCRPHRAQSRAPRGHSVAHRRARAHGDA